MLRDIKQKIMLKDNSIQNSLQRMEEENSNCKKINQLTEEINDAYETITNLKSKLALKVREHSNTVDTRYSES